MPQQYETDSGYVSGRKYGRPLGPTAPHYPNSAERKLLEKLMRDGKCSEAEVRKSKENRQALAAAARSMSLPKGTRHEYEQKMRRRRIAQQLGLLATDPKVTEALKAWNNLPRGHSLSYLSTMGYMSRFFK